MDRFGAGQRNPRYRFYDHDRYHGGVNFDELDRLREKNPDVKIRAGIELDNDPETSAAGRKWVEQNWKRLDFVLGSVHYLNRADQMFDSVPEGAQQFTGRDIDNVYSDYFRRVREMAASGLVDCLAHLDLVKIHGHRPRAQVTELVEETLELIRARNLAIELSTAGWRKPVTNFIRRMRSFFSRWRRRFPLPSRRTHIHGRSWEKITNASGRKSRLLAFAKCAYTKNTSGLFTGCSYGTRASGRYAQRTFCPLF